MRTLGFEAAQLCCVCHHGYKSRVPQKLPDGEQHSAGNTSPAWEGTDTFSTPHLAQQRKTALFSKAPGIYTGRKAVLFPFPPKATRLSCPKGQGNQGAETLCRLKSTQQHRSCCLWRAFHHEVIHSTSWTPSSCHFTHPRNPGTPSAS